MLALRERKIRIDYRILAQRSNRLVLVLFVVSRQRKPDAAERFRDGDAVGAVWLLWSVCRTGAIDGHSPLRLVPTRFVNHSAELCGSNQQMLVNQPAIFSRFAGLVPHWYKVIRLIARADEDSGRTEQECDGQTIYARPHRSNELKLSRA